MGLKREKAAWSNEYIAWCTGYEIFKRHFLVCFSINYFVLWCAVV